MNLLPTIISYYQGEARHGFFGAVIGGVLLIGSLILLKWTSPLSLLKGLSLPMLLFGLLVGIGGAADGIYTSKITPGKIALYQKDSTAFLKQEKVKVEKIHRGWHGIRIFWGILGLSGLVLSLLITKPFWMGAGLGTLALAIIISLFELFSMRFNERYYQVIQYTTAQEPAINTNKISTGALQQVKVQPIVIELKSNKQIDAKAANDPLPQQILPFDSLKSLSPPGITTVIARDPANLNTPDGLQLPVWTDETASVYRNEKKREVPDNYNADLSLADSVHVRHCWLSKKYIKG